MNTNRLSPVSNLAQEMSKTVLSHCPKSTARRSLSMEFDVVKGTEENSQRSPKKKVSLPKRTMGVYINNEDYTTVDPKSLSNSSLWAQPSESLPALLLPSFSDPRRPEFNSVTPDLVARLLDNEFAHIVTKYVIVDCRFSYEYEAGHIRGAINLSTSDEIQSYFMTNPQEHAKTVIVFHCEFSSRRAPLLLKQLRALDRIANWENWPSLCYPHLYLLQGGYAAFFKTKQEYCEPRNYVSMFDMRYREDCKIGLKKCREDSCSKRGGRDENSADQKTTSYSLRRPLFSSQPTPEIIKEHDFLSNSFKSTPRLLRSNTWGSLL